MHLTRRDFLELAIVTGAFMSTNPVAALAKMNYDDIMRFKPVGNVTLLFTTDMHAHLEPLYFAEPMNLVAPKKLIGTPGYITGMEFLRYYKIAPGTLEAYFTSPHNHDNQACDSGKRQG